MQITLKTYSDLRRVIGKTKSVIEIDDDSTLKDLISVLIEKYAERFEREKGSSLKEGFSRNFNVYLRGRLIYPPKYSRTKLQDRDEVIILRPVGGGLLARQHRD